MEFEFEATVFDDIETVVQRYGENVTMAQGATVPEATKKAYDGLPEAAVNVGCSYGEHEDTGNIVAVLGYEQETTAGGAPADGFVEETLDPR